MQCIHMASAMWMHSLHWSGSFCVMHCITSMQCIHLASAKKLVVLITCYENFVVVNFHVSLFSSLSISDKSNYDENFPDNKKHHLPHPYMLLTSQTTRNIPSPSHTTRNPRQQKHHLPHSIQVTSTQALLSTRIYHSLKQVCAGYTHIHMQASYGLVWETVWIK